MDGVIVAIVAIAVVLGAKKLPEMARSFGRAQGEFKKGLREGDALSSDEAHDGTAPPTTSPPRPDQA
jgi:sec-independent protein translocase protein TatA